MKYSPLPSGMNAFMLCVSPNKHGGNVLPNPLKTATS